MKLERIQILRFVAAAAVVAFHAEVTLGDRIGNPGTLWPLRYGYLGVDLFFVISGFIIHLTVRSRERDWRLFLRRRAVRIVPLYWLCTLAMFVWMPFLADSGLPSRLFLAESLLFVTWASHPGQWPLVYLGWSLEYEVLFYVLSAAAMAFSTRPWRLVCPVLGGAVLAGVMLGADATTPLLSFLTNPLLLEFAFGLLVGEALARRRVPWLELAPVALAAVCVFPLAWGERVWVAGVPCAVLVFALARRDAQQPVPGGIARWFAGLGDASYSIYLAQVFTIGPLVALALVLTPLPVFVPTVVVVTVLSLAAGWLLHRLVERPLQHRLRPARRGE